jgi:hypothetical protein
MVQSTTDPLAKDPSETLLEEIENKFVHTLSQDERAKRMAMANTLQVTELRNALSLRESDVPCLHVTLLPTLGRGLPFLPSCTIQLGEIRHLSVYSIFKSLMEILAPVIERASTSEGRRLTDAADEITQLIAEIPTLISDQHARRASWDFFVSYPAMDRVFATTVARALLEKGSVFFDNWCLRPGDDWQRLIPSMQESSSATVALITKNTECAFFQQAEIQRAICLLRQSKHRIIPLLVKNAGRLPFGLETLHAIEVETEEQLPEAIRVLTRDQILAS